MRFDPLSNLLLLRVVKGGFTPPTGLVIQPNSTVTLPGIKSVVDRFAGHREDGHQLSNAKPLHAQQNTVSPLPDLMRLTIAINAA
jgi:hypothetical protein